MNHLDLDEQARVLEHPEDYSLSTRNDVAGQQGHNLWLRSKQIGERLPPAPVLFDEQRKFSQEDFDSMLTRARSKERR